MKTSHLIYLLEEISSEEKVLSDMFEAWEGDDPLNETLCDPSEQYIQGGKIENLQKEFLIELVDSLSSSQLEELKTLVSSKDTNLKIAKM